ncbi:hypothetical protein D3C85_1327580 [compost metagenome]
MQRKGEIVNRNREVQLCAVFHRLSEQLCGRFRHEFHVRHQFRNVDVLRRQTGTQDVIGVRHHFQRHALQVSVRRFGKQEHRIARIQLHHVQQQRGEEAAVVRVEFRDQANGLPRFALLAVQRGFQHCQRVRFFVVLHVQQAGKKLAQARCIRVFEEMGDGMMGACDRLQQGDNLGELAEGVHRQEWC